MSNSNDSIRLDPPWRQAVVDAIKDYGYGDVIPMDWLYIAFEIETPKTGTYEQFKAVSFQFLNAMDRFREDLLKNHKMALLNVRGEGYRIINPAEHADVAKDKFRYLVAKALDTAETLIEHTAFDRLTQEEAQKSRELQGKLAAFRAMSKKQLRGQDRIDPPDDTGR